jgi:DNA topoisomerase-3
MPVLVNELHLQKEIGRMLTYGPCQTPTMGFVVEQAERIKWFVPETFWTIDVSVTDEEGTKATLQWDRKRVFDKISAIIVFDRIKNSEAYVESIVESNATKPRPNGLNTVKLLKVASKSFGMSAHETMRIAESLYLRGYVTYPRTESTNYSTNFDFNEVLKEHQHSQ